MTALTAYYNDGGGASSRQALVGGAPPVGPHGKPASVPTGLNTGEYIAFTKCVEAYLLDTSSRADKTVKVNVAWDENDYQIDVGTEEGMTEYKRIIDRNAEFGVTHIVYDLSTRYESAAKQPQTVGLGRFALVVHGEHLQRPGAEEDKCLWRSSR